MSTDHQRYSTANQQDEIAACAVCRGLEIVRTYADEGKSGLDIGGREALQLLIADVQRRGCGIEVVLGYDISRPRNARPDGRRGAAR